jgi:hypothetical protein
MITPAEREYVEERAYLPEHIPQYVSAISMTEPFIFDDYIVHAKRDHLIFVGYPLQEPFNEKQMEKAFQDAMRCLKPGSVALIAPAIPSYVNGRDHPPSDHYYRLDLSAFSISQKLRNMLTRASRELSVERARRFGREHKKLVDNFLKVHPVDEGAQVIFKRIDKYLSSSTTAWVFDARSRKGELVAFDVAEFKARDYAIYMFNFTSAALYVPGASDLLLSEVIQEAKKERKKFVNLGLGINPGVTFFKKKWGGVAFLPYASCLYHPSRRENLETLLQKLS